MTRSPMHRIMHIVGAVCTAMLLTAAPAAAQPETVPGDPAPFPEPRPSRHLILRPSIGVQTMWFNGDYPVSQDISPGRDRELPLGGGVLGSNNGVHIGLDIIPVENGIIRFPVVFEAYFLNGKTTFPLTLIHERPTRYLTYTHTANIYSAGFGVALTAVKFKHQQLYLGAEGRFNYVTATSLVPREYYPATDETISERTLTPDSTGHARIGAYVKVGFIAEFFDPLMLDFSIGYGGLNVLNRNTDPATGRNLMVVDPNPAAEVMLGYVGIAFNVLWRL